MDSCLVFLNEMHRKAGQFKRFLLKLLFLLSEWRRWMKLYMDRKVCTLDTF